MNSSDMWELVRQTPSRLQDPLEPHQRIAATGFRGHVLLAGRGAGKSYAGMRWLNDRCLEEDGLRARIIAPTFGDGVASCVDGPNGLLLASGFRATWHPSEPGGAVVKYPNKSKVWVIGTNGPKDVDRLRALTNVTIDVFEEAFANPRLTEAWAQANLSRRRGDTRVVVTSTPRPHPLIKVWEDDPNYNIVRATMRDNPHNEESWVEEQERLYAGTRLYRQEILGEVLEDVEGALWTLRDLERSTYHGDRSELLSRLVKVVVGVDPASGPGTTGIVVVGLDREGHLYVLDDYSLTDVSPHQWASAVAAAASDYGALVVAEVNQGGRMVREVMKQAQSDLPISEVNASKGKEARAEPIALKWEADEQTAHLAPSKPEKLAKLTDELTSWVPKLSKNSPDRLDAMVWAATYLTRNSGGGPHVAEIGGSTLPGL